MRLHTNLYAILCTRGTIEIHMYVYIRLYISYYLRTYIPGKEVCMYAYVYVYILLASMSICMLVHRYVYILYTYSHDAISTGGKFWMDFMDHRFIHVSRHCCTCAISH